MRVRAWEQVQPFYLQRLAGLIDRFHVAAAREQATGELAAAARAVVAGRIDTLLVEAERRVAGSFDPVNGKLALGRLDDPYTDDLLDDLGEQVLRSAGEVVVVPAARMPTDTGLAAIYRF